MNKIYLLIILLGLSFTIYAFWSKNTFVLTLDEKISHIEVKFKDDYKLGDSIDIVLANGEKIKTFARYFHTTNIVIKKGYYKFTKFVFKDNALFLLRGEGKNFRNDNGYITESLIKFADFSHMDKDIIIFKTSDNSSYKIWQNTKQFTGKTSVVLGVSTTYQRKFKKELILGEWSFTTSNRIDDEYIQKEVRDNYIQNHARIFEKYFYNFYFNNKKLSYKQLANKIPNKYLEFNALKKLTTLNSNYDYYKEYNIKFLNRPLAITLNQKSYNTGDIFEVEVKNKTYEDLSYFALQAQQYIDGKWIVIRNDLDCPCKNKCKKSAFYLKGKHTQKHHWDFKDYICNTVKKGIYKITAFDYEYGIIGESKDFNIEQIWIIN